MFRVNRKHVRCVGAALIGLFAGWSILAYAQPAPPPASPTNTGVASIAYLVQSLGLPGALAFVGWLLSRNGGIPVRVTVELSATDREFVRNLRHDSH